MVRPGTAVWILLGCLLAGLLGVPVGTADSLVTSHDAPIHDVGDMIGFGTSADLGAAAAPLIGRILQLDAKDPNITFHELRFAGTFDLWSTTEVVGETSEVYAIQTDSALGFRLDYEVNVTSTKFPQAGTHPGDMRSGTCLPGPIPVTTETLVADVNITYLLASSGLSYWTVSDFALVEDETNISIELAAPVVYRNLPVISLNETACEFTVEYASFDGTLSADVGLDVRTAYAPALDLFAFPLGNEVWSIHSNVTQAARIRGTLDADGLTPEEEAEYFEHLRQVLESAGLSASGLDKFPIVLEDVTLMLGLIPVLKDGVIHDVTFPLTASLQARESNMTLADGQLHTVYLISVPGDLCSRVYSPDDGFIVGLRCEFMGVPFFELPNVPPGVAEQRIADTKRGYSLRPTTSGAVPASLGDFFLKPPFSGALVLAAAVALIVVVLVVHRRMRPPAGMPPTPPQAPPPGPL